MGGRNGPLPVYLVLAGDARQDETVTGWRGGREHSSLRQAMRGPTR